MTTTGTTGTAERREPPAWLNRLITAILRSPLHGLVSRQLALVTFTGRKSGRQYTTPITYVEQGGRLLFFNGKGWWRNLTGGAPVQLRLRGRDREGIASPSTDIPTIVREMRVYLEREGLKNARMIGMEIDTSRPPTDEELAAIAQRRAVIYVELR